MDSKYSSRIADVSRHLVDVTMGRVTADLVVKNARWVCVQSGEVLDGIDVAIAGERIAYVGPSAGYTIGSGTQIVPARSRYLVPGLLDGHMHVESSLLTLTEFVRAVVPHGTTGIFPDPHEMANVLGLAGVRMMWEEAREQPIHVWHQMPSCAPTMPRFETSGAEIDAEDVREAFRWEGMVGLGEVMDHLRVIGGDEFIHAVIAEAKAVGKVVGGHFAVRDSEKVFSAYASAGIDDDHEGTTAQDAILRVRQGMKAMLRCGTTTDDMTPQLAAILELGLDSRHCLLVTDGTDAATIIREGHMDRVVRRAIAGGLSPMMAIQMATINTAQHFGLTRDVGMIAPGRFADMLLVPDLEAFECDMVIAKGKVVAEGGAVLFEAPAYTYPSEARNSVHVSRELQPEDFHCLVQHPDGVREVNLIQVQHNRIATGHATAELPIIDGQISPDVERDIGLLAILDRHHCNGLIKFAFVQGFNLRADCASGSTIAHDSHHMILLGTNPASMARAANELVKLNGGHIVVRKDEVLASLALPIAGLLSDGSAMDVSTQIETLVAAYKECGCKLRDPHMHLSRLSLVCIPSLRLSDRGLVDVDHGEIIPLIAG